MFDSGLDHPAVFTALAGFVLVLAFYLLGWWLTGRDPEPADRDDQATPPRNLSAPVMRFLRRMAADTPAAAAALMSLAVKGHLVMEWEGGRIRLRKAEGRGSPPLPDCEAALAHDLLYTRSTLVLHNTAYKVVAPALRRFRRRLAREHGRAVFRANRGWLIAGLALSLLVLAAVAAQSGAPAAFLVLSALAVAAVIALAALMQVLLPQRYIFPEPLSHSLRAALRRAVEAGFIVVASPLAFVALADMIADPPVPLMAVAVTAALAGLHVVVYHLIKAPTVRGAAVRRRIDRFRSKLAGAADAPDASPIPAGIYAFALDLPEGAPAWSSAPAWLRVTEPDNAPRSYQKLGEALTRALDAAAMPPAKTLLSGPPDDARTAPSAEAP